VNSTWQDGLLAVLDGDCPLAVDPQRLSHGAQEEAARLARSAPASVRAAARPGKLAEQVAAALGSLTANAGTGPSLLATELAGRMETAWRLARTPPAMLRVDVVHERTCPRFHLDRLRLRLCCTAFGLGTEWLAGRDPPGPDYEAAVHPAPQHLPTGHLVAMAGSLSGQGLVHRSPPASPNSPRLFIALDLS